MSKDKNSQEIDLSKYKDSDGLSMNKLSFGLWLSERRKSLNRLLILFLIGISVFFFSYSTYNYVIYFLNETPEEDHSLTNVTAPKNQVTDLSVSNPQAIRINGVYDLIASLRNANEKFAANFKYCFLIDGEEFLCNSNFILPNEEKYLIAFNKQIDNTAAAVSLEVSEISWQRIDNREIPDWNTFVNERLNFLLNDIDLTSSGDSANNDNNLNALSFSITNRSPYSYYEVPLNITFYRGDRLAGVHRHVVTDFLAGETKNVRLNWVSNLSGVTRTEIRPELNILDENVYLKYQGGR